MKKEKYVLRHGDEYVLDFFYAPEVDDFGVDDIYNDRHDPISLGSEKFWRPEHYGDNWEQVVRKFQRFLGETRIVPSARPEIDATKKEFAKLGVCTLKQASLESYLRSIGDNYWAHSADVDMTFEQVSFSDPDKRKNTNATKYLANYGIKELSDWDPENTLLTSGQAPKGIYSVSRPSDGEEETWMKKGGRAENFFMGPVAEVAAAKAGNILGYRVANSVLRTQVGKDGTVYPYAHIPVFTHPKKSELITASQIAEVLKPARGGNNTVDHLLDCCDEIGIPRGKMESQLLRQSILRYVMGDWDLHHGNFGEFRNPETLQWSPDDPYFYDFDNGLLPQFNRLSDTSQAIFHRSEFERDPSIYKDWFIKPESVTFAQRNSRNYNTHPKNLAMLLAKFPKSQVWEDANEKLRKLQDVFPHEIVNLVKKNPNFPQQHSEFLAGTVEDRIKNIRGTIGNHRADK